MKGVSRSGAIARYFAISVGAWSGVGGLSAQQPVAAAQSDGRSDRTFQELLARPVTVTLERVSLIRAIDSVSRLTNVLVQYRLPVLASYTTPVSIRVTREPLGVTLERILNGTRLRVVSDGQGRLLIVESNGAQAHDSVPAVGTINGRVVDSATGRGIAGATIRVVGTKQGTVTADSGRFLLRDVATGERTLTIKAFGYRPTERTVDVTSGAPVRLRVGLAVAPNLLSGVITTATGVQERRSIGNDVTVINVDSVMRTAPIHSVTDLLDTRVPGLTVQRTSGIPGAPSRLRLRGIGGGLVGGTNTSNDPIVIVDGVRVYSRESTPRDRSLASDYSGGFAVANPYATPSAIDQIDPNSIETIEVFKGPSATSQWGSDAGNGVIVITTKRGRAGPTRVAATADVSVEKMPGTYTAPVDYFFGRFNGYTASGDSQLCNGDFNVAAANAPCFTAFRDSIVPFQALNIPRLSPFGTGVEEGGTVSLFGGSAAMTYALTVSANDHLGYQRMPPLFQDAYEFLDTTHAPSWMTRPDRNRTWNGLGTFGIIPMEGLRLTFTTSISNGNQSQTNAQSVAALASTYIDTVSVLTHTSAAAGALSGYVTRNRFQSVTTNNVLQTDWIRWEWLPMTGTVGVNTVERTDRTDIPYGVAVATNTTSSPYTGFYSVGRGVAVTRDASISTTLLPHRLVSTAIGLQLTQQSTNDLSAYQDTLQPGVETPTSLRSASQLTWASNTAGWFIEPKLNFASRFFASPGFRFDGGSASTARGSANRGILSVFPKLNLTWIAVDREDRPLGGVLSLLRPRLAYGIAGVQPDPQWNERLMKDSANTGGLQLYKIGNSQLHPERSQEMEGGVDVQLWNNRVSFVGTMFSKLRRDAIVSIKTAPSLYATQLYLNLGRVRNSGMEFAIEGSVIETPIVRWGVHAKFGSNRNTLLSINASSAGYLNTNNSGGSSVYRVGFPLDGVWTRPIVGYIDANGDGQLSRDEVTVADSTAYAGSGQPRYELPFGTSLSLWHGLVAINAEFQYIGKQTQVNSGATQQILIDYYTQNAPFPVQAAALGLAGCDNAGNAYPGWQCSQTSIIQTVSSLRFNSLSVSYDVPRTVRAKLRLPSMNIALQGQNLRLWTNYRGKDPNVNSQTVGEGFSDGGQFPLPRTWGIRVNVGN